MRNVIETLERAMESIRSWNFASCAQGISEAITALHKLREQQQVNPDNYVAWLRWVGRDGSRRLVVCNSDDDGAFRVYRH